MAYEKVLIQLYKQSWRSLAGSICVGRADSLFQPIPESLAPINNSENNSPLRYILLESWFFYRQNKEVQVIYKIHENTTLNIARWGSLQPMLAWQRNYDHGDKMHGTVRSGYKISRRVVYSHGERTLINWMISVLHSAFVQNVNKTFCQLVL